MFFKFFQISSKSEDFEVPFNPFIAKYEKVQNTQKKSKIWKFLVIK